jgi:hypothetical protein
MKPETMFYIALGTVVDLFTISDSYKVFADTADGEEERKRGMRKSLKYKAKAVVGFDREIDRLVKEYS